MAKYSTITVDVTAAVNVSIDCKPPYLATCITCTVCTLRWHGCLSAKVNKNANLGYSHDRGLS